MTGRPTVSVTSTELWQKNKKYTVYKILITSGDDTWFLFKRYNEFYRLYEKLRKKVPDMQFKFPGKRLFGNNFDPLFIRSRKEGLDDFLQQTLADERLFLQSEVQDFLQIEKSHSGSEESIETETDTTDSEVPERAKIDLGPSERAQVRPSDFEFLKVIGKGSFGRVLLARHHSGDDRRLYAVKVLQKSAILQRNESRHIMAERNVLLQNMNHPFLVGLHFSFQTADKLYFVLDYVNGGELFFHLQRERCFPEARAKFYGAELASAIGYLHSRGVVYRDLKPENILLDSEGHLRLTDFGLCKEGLRTCDTIDTFCGTPEYLAPEILKKQPYDMSVDWWCLGAVLYEMMHGLPPFYSRNVSEMYDNILHKPLRLYDTVSPAARNILQGLLQKDKKLRLGAGEADFEDIKSHEFFKPIDWDELVRKRIKPPYAPQLNGQLDLRNIDPEFTKETIPSSITKSQQNGVAGNASFVKEAEAAFMGFSYVPSAELM